MDAPARPARRSTRQQRLALEAVSTTPRASDRGMGLRGRPPSAAAGLARDDLPEPAAPRRGGAAALLRAGRAHALRRRDLELHDHFACVRCGSLMDISRAPEVLPAERTAARAGVFGRGTHSRVSRAVPEVPARPIDQRIRRRTHAETLNTKTHENLKHAFAGESQANRRYLYFARRADIEGFPDVGGLFRDTSEAETGHAFGHLDFLKEVGDPATELRRSATRSRT